MITMPPERSRPRPVSSAMIWPSSCSVMIWYRSAGGAPKTSSMTFWTVSANLRSSSGVRPFWTSIRTSGMSLLSVAGCQRRGIRSGAVHACRSGVDEVRSVVLTEVVLQFLEGAATSLWAELPDKQERDRIDEREQAEGQRGTQG